MHERHKYRTVDDAVSQVSLRTIADMKVEDFVGHLKQRGITSLDDLARASIGVAKSGVAGGVAAIDPEDFPICYKFTVKPHFRDSRDFSTVVDQIKTADIGRPG